MLLSRHVIRLVFDCVYSLCKSVCFNVVKVGTSLFNRGMLFNVGVKEALKDRDYDCFALHDVDLIPENQKNFYRCSEKAKHMSALIYRSYRKYSW